MSEPAKVPVKIPRGLPRGLPFAAPGKGRPGGDDDDPDEGVRAMVDLFVIETEEPSPIPNPRREPVPGGADPWRIPNIPAKPLPSLVPALDINFGVDGGMPASLVPPPYQAGPRPNLQGQEIEQWFRQLNNQFQQQPHIQLPLDQRGQGNFPTPSPAGAQLLSRIQSGMDLTETMLTELLGQALPQLGQLYSGVERGISTLSSPENRYLAATAAGVIGLGGLGIAGYGAFTSGGGGVGFMRNMSAHMKALTGQGGVFEGF